MKRLLLLCPLALTLAAAQEPQPRPNPPAERKGDVQLAEPEKGSVTNLGTDVTAVRQRIESALATEPSLKGAAFTINVTDDTVEISGVANNGRERTAARRIVQSFAGNLRVKDRITVAGVTPPSADQTPPADAANAKKNAPAAEQETISKPESDEDQPDARKGNKPKKDPKKHGDQATEDPRDPRKK